MDKIERILNCSSLESDIKTAQRQLQTARGQAKLHTRERLQHLQKELVVRQQCLQLLHTVNADSARQSTYRYYLEKIRLASMVGKDCESWYATATPAWVPAQLRQDGFDVVKTDDGWLVVRWAPKNNNAVL